MIMLLIDRFPDSHAGCRWAGLLRRLWPSAVNGRGSLLLVGACGGCFHCGHCVVSCRWAGLAGIVSGCRFLDGQAVLQAGVAELVDGPDRAQDAAAAGVFEEPHEANRGPVRCRELCKREGGRPRLGIHEPDQEPGHQPASEPVREAACEMPGPDPERNPEREPNSKPDYEPDHEPERLITAP